MKWNNELDNQLKMLIDNHHNYNEISKKMNISIKSLQNRAFRLGLKINLIVTVVCSNCDKEINRCRSTINENNNFCSKSCAAIFNNKKRKHTEETKEKIRNKLKILVNYNKCSDDRNQKNAKKINNKPLFKFIRIKKCEHCNNLVPIKNKICDKCKLNYYDYYRPVCEFKFNLNDYPNEFDFELVKKYGWYSPTNKKNNLFGVSRDHMYCVRDGFINKINPEIIKHPANCRLMIHNENNVKNCTSTITIGELLERIKMWDMKYNVI